MHLFAVALSLADRDTPGPTSQLHIASIDDVPTGAHRAALNFDVLVCDPIPEIADPLVAVAAIEFDFVDILPQQFFLLSLSGTLPWYETQEPTLRMHMESLHAMSPNAVVHPSICTYRAIGFDHELEMIENVPPRHLANVEALSQFAVNLVPWPTDVAAQESLERPKHIAEPLTMASILSYAARRNELGLIFIVVIVDEREPLTPFAIFASAAMTLSLDDNFVHVRAHLLTNAF